MYCFMWTCLKRRDELLPGASTSEGRYDHNYSCGWKRHSFRILMMGNGWGRTPVVRVNESKPAVMSAQRCAAFNMSSSFGRAK